MLTPKPKSAYLHVRVTPQVRSKFHAKAIKYSNPSDVLRELVEAFVEDRLIIQAPVTRKESMYVNRNAN